MQTVQLQLTTVADNHNMFIMHCSLIYSWVSHRFKVDVRFKRISPVCVVCHIYIYFLRLTSMFSLASTHMLANVCQRAQRNDYEHLRPEKICDSAHTNIPFYPPGLCVCVCVCFWTPHTVSHYECRVFDVQASIHDSLPWRRRPNHPPNKLRIWRS